MVAAKREAMAARPKREYPTEWAMYPSDDEETERQQLQIEEPKTYANPASACQSHQERNDHGMQRRWPCGSAP